MVDIFISNIKATRSLFRIIPHSNFDSEQRRNTKILFKMKNFGFLLVAFVVLLCNVRESTQLSIPASKNVKKVILGTKFKRCVQHHELRATDCYFLGGFVRSNLSKPCAIPSITFLHQNLSAFEYGIS